LLTFKQPESALAKHVVKLAGTRSTLRTITRYMLFLTVVIILCKFLIVHGYEIEFFKKHDYTLNLLAMETTRIQIQIQVVLYVVICLPCVLISIVSLFGEWMSPFLWDLSVIQVGSLAAGHLISILSVLSWEMPNELKAYPTDFVFWAINLVPVGTALLQLLYLAPHVSSVRILKKR